MAQDVIRERLCEWNSDQDRRQTRGDKLHLAKARFIVYENDRIELCQDCAELPRFKNAQKEIIPEPYSKSDVP